MHFMRLPLVAFASLMLVPAAFAAEADATASHSGIHLAQLDGSPADAKKKLLEQSKPKQKQKADKPKPAPKPKADAKPKPAPKPKAESKPKPAPKPKAEAKPKPKPAPKPKAEAKPTPKPKAEAKPKPAPKPEKPKAKADSKPASKSERSVKDVAPSLAPATEEAAPEPKPEPVPEPAKEEPKPEPKPEPVEPETEARKPEPAPVKPKDETRERSGQKDTSKDSRKKKQEADQKKATKPSATKQSISPQRSRDGDRTRSSDRSRDGSRDASRKGSRDGDRHREGSRHGDRDRDRRDADRRHRDGDRDRYSHYRKDWQRNDRYRRGQDRNDFSTKSMLTGLAIGAVVGATAPVLFDNGQRRFVEDDGRVYVYGNDQERFNVYGDGYNERLSGGRTREVYRRPDGTEIITVRGPDGYILTRTRRYPGGREVVLIDDVRRGPPPPVVLGPVQYAGPRDDYVVDYGDASRDRIYNALRAQPVERLPRTYTLEEVREYPRIRERMPRVDISTVTFDTDSSVIEESQVPEIEYLADILNEILEENPEEVFMIEGHTDATGPELYNLALSDRRAESVAIVLSDYYGIPPENLVTQGYGEEYLEVPTEGPERRNRRVTVRRITPLIRSADAR